MKRSFSVALFVAMIQWVLASSSLACGSTSMFTHPPGQKHDLLIVHAVRYGDLAEVTRLIALDPANLEASDTNDLTPLHHAVQEGHLAIVQALTTSGANVNAADQDRSTPLHDAASTGRLDIVQALITSGADVNAADRFGYTPLYVAAEKSTENDDLDIDHTATVQALIAAGADVNTLYGDGYTLLQLTQEFGIAAALQPQAIAQVHTQKAGDHTTTGNHVLAARSHTWAAQALPGTESASISHTRAAESHIASGNYAAASQSYGALFNCLIARVDLLLAADRIAAIDEAEAQANFALETTAAAVDGELEAARTRDNNQGPVVEALCKAATQIQAAIEQVNSAAAASRAAIE